MNRQFLTSLDRYLTTPPEENDEYFDQVIECIDSAVWEVYEEKFFDTDTETDWLNDLRANSYAPSEAAEIVQQAFCIYLLNESKTKNNG